MRILWRSTDQLLRRCLSQRASTRSVWMTLPHVEGSIPGWSPTASQLQQRHGFSSSSSSSETTESAILLEAEAVRDRPVSGSRAIRQQALQELGTLEEALQAALASHEQVLLLRSQQQQQEDDTDAAVSVSNHQDARRSLETLRDCYENLSYWEDALETEQALQELCETATDEAAALYRRGKLSMRLQQIPQAARYYQQALVLYQSEYGDAYHADIGNLFISMAGVQFHREKLPAALQLLVEAQDHFQRHGSPVTADDDSATEPHIDLVKCLQHQGLVHRMMQENDTALTKYQIALTVLEQQPHQLTPLVYAEKRQALMLDMADQYAALDEPSQALELYEAILQQDRAQRSPNDDTNNNNSKSNEPTALEGVLLHATGKIRAQQGEHEQALANLQQAVTIKELHAGETSQEVAKSLDALGAVYAVTGDKAQAHECFQRSLLIARMHSAAGDVDPAVMLALRNLTVLKGQHVPKWGSEE